MAEKLISNIIKSTSSRVISGVPSTFLNTTFPYFHAGDKDDKSRSVKHLSLYRGTPAPGGKEAEGVERRRMSKHMYELLNVCVESHGNAGANVSEHVLQNRLSGSGGEEERKGVKTPSVRGFNTPAGDLGGKARYPFRKMHKTDAVSKDPFCRKSTHMSHV